MTLALVDVKDSLDNRPAAFHALGARRYIGVSRTTFDKLVHSGLIPYAEHVNGTARIYRREDLDAYLASLKWRKMSERENSQAAVFPKGVAK